MTSRFTLQPNPYEDEAGRWFGVETGSRLDQLGISFPFLIAPMVGISHVAFRDLIRSYIPAGVKALQFTEMLSSRRLPSSSLETSDTARILPEERDFIPQLLCNEERFIEASIEKLMKRHPWGLDINMGCPVSHTLKHNWGVRLMGDKDYAARVVACAKRHSPLPVSVKLRGGPKDCLDANYLTEFTQALEAAGADWLTIHARPRGRRHKGSASWSLVSTVRQRLSIPVVANGDIQCAEDALRVMRDYDVDGAMIARASLARPWILWQIAYRLGHFDGPPGRRDEAPPMTALEEGREYVRACRTLLALLEHHFGEDEEDVLKKFRFFVAMGSKWFFFGHSFWARTTKTKTVADLRAFLEEYGERTDHKLTERVAL